VTSVFGDRIFGGVSNVVAGIIQKMWRGFVDLVDLLRGGFGGGVGRGDSVCSTMTSVVVEGST
jgi:hypothetical protein